jgi:hypothetical protein
LKFLREVAATLEELQIRRTRDDFDEWLARIVCFAFSVPPQWAVKQMNRATADNQSAQSEEEGLEPTKEWVKDLIDEIIAEEFSSPDLELHWLDEDDGAAENEAALGGRVKLGALTLNEMRDSLGLDPFDNAAADRPMVLTATGYVPIEAGVEGGGANAQTTPSVEKRSLIKDYDPGQPRVPAGNSDGGQWTSESGGESSSESAIGSELNSTSLQVRYASLAVGTRTDATPESGSVQYAGGVENDDEEVRPGGRQFDGTPAQQARQAVAEAQYGSVLARVLRLDPAWKPSASLVTPDSIEGDIAKLKAATQEAETHLAYLKSLGFPRDPETGHVIPPTAPKTGNPRVDTTTDILMTVLQKVVDQVGPRPDLLPRDYGTLIHARFADAVRALNLPGIDTNDVERTFGVDDENTYHGANDSIRPDVIVRDDNDNIIAIYDVKTGRGLDEPRVIRIRYMTESDRTIPVIELHPSRGALSKRN